MFSCSETHPDYLSAVRELEENRDERLQLAIKMKEDQIKNAEDAYQAEVQQTHDEFKVIQSPMKV